MGHPGRPNGPDSLWGGTVCSCVGNNNNSYNIVNKVRCFTALPRVDQGDPNVSVRGRKPHEKDVVKEFVVEFGGLGAVRKFDVFATRNPGKRRSMVNGI